MSLSDHSYAHNPKPLIQPVGQGLLAQTPKSPKSLDIRAVPPDLGFRGAGGAGFSLLRVRLRPPTCTVSVKDIHPSRKP